MKIKSMGFFIVLVSLFVLVTGCTITGKNPDFYKGTEGIYMEFLQDSPPNVVYFDPENPGNEFSIILNVKNKGSSDTAGGIYISGYDPHVISIAGDSKAGSSNIRISNSGGILSFSIGNIYIGYSGNSRGTGKANICFKDPKGRNCYGGQVFMDNGQIKGVNINVDVARRGGKLAQMVLTNVFGKTFGWNSIFFLQGNTREYPGGEAVVLEFPAEIYDLEEGLEEFNQPFLVTSCYEYTTLASPMMCIDPNPTANVQKVCRPSTVGLSGGQGAPVAVTSVEEQASAHKAIFTIRVQNVGRGTVYDVWQLDKCDPSSGLIVKPSDLNVVYMGLITMSGIPLECNPENGAIRLVNGAGYITCTYEYDTMSSSAYKAPLSIELWYGYSQSIRKDIKIKKI